jgi:hypothetical protein
MLVEVNNSNAAAFAATLPTPPNFANPTSVLNYVAGLGITCNEIYKIRTFRIGPNIRRPPYEKGRLNDCKGLAPHRQTIRQWRLLSTKLCVMTPKNYRRFLSQNPFEVDKSVYKNTET